MISQNGQRGKARLYKLAENVLDKMDDSGVNSLTPMEMSLATFYVLATNAEVITTKQDAMLAELRKFNQSFKLLRRAGEVLGGAIGRVLR